MNKLGLLLAVILGGCGVKSDRLESKHQLKTVASQTIDPDIHNFLPIEVYIPLFRYPKVRVQAKDKILSKLRHLYPDQSEVDEIHFPCRLKESEREILIAIALAENNIRPDEYFAVRKSLFDLTNPPGIMQDEGLKNLEELTIFQIVQSASQRDTFSDSELLQTPKDVFLEQKALYGFPALSQAFNFEKCRQNTESPIVLAAVLHWLETESPSTEEVSRLLETTWVMVQHLDDETDLQVRFLEIMKQIGFKDNKVKRQYAYLYDRIKFNSGEPQRYGTQVVYTTTGCSPGKLEDDQNIQKLRSEMGLGSLKEYYSSHPGC